MMNTFSYRNNVLAVIPARGGSKGIHLKNIRDLGGMPLICYPVDKAMRSKHIDDVILATDNGSIAAMSKTIFPNLKVVMRPPEISHDTSRIEETLLYVLDKFPADIVVIIEATNPLLRVEDIDRAIEMVKGEYDSCLLSKKEYGFLVDDKDLIERPMRQMRVPMVFEAGGCWVTKVETLKRCNNRLGGKIGAVEIPKETTIHIDNEVDWRIAEALVGRSFPVRESRGKFEEDYWGEVVDPDGVKRNLLNEREKSLNAHGSIIDYLDSQAGKILDVGCGLGWMLSGLNGKWEKHGTEISKFAAGKASEYGAIWQGDLAKAKYPDNNFDVVLCLNVVEHAKDPEGLVAEIRRVLKPYGKFIMRAPDFQCAMAQRYGEKFRLLHDKTHRNLFSLLQMNQLLTDNLFAVEKIEYPYFETEYFTEENLMRLFDKDGVSPPFPGNIVTFYCYKK